LTAIAQYLNQLSKALQYQGIPFTEKFPNQFFCTVVMSETTLVIDFTCKCQLPEYATDLVSGFDQALKIFDPQTHCP
jgi:hypothetical protein